MRTHTAFAAALILGLSVFACAGNTSSSDGAAQGPEQDIKSGRSPLVGAWTISSDSAGYTSSIAYVLRPNGEFWRDDNRVLNGVFVNGAPHPVQRATGTYTVDTDAQTITFHETSPMTFDQTMSYSYQAGRVLNGMFLPGHEPDTHAHLTLTGIAAPGSNVAFPALKYDSADSWCTSTKDCTTEAEEQIWSPGEGSPITCDDMNRVCIAGETVAPDPATSN